MSIRRAYAVQILACLNAHRSFPQDCTRQECKNAINALVRKCASKIPLNQIGASMMSNANPTMSTKLDHVIPVDYVVESIMEMADNFLLMTSGNFTAMEVHLEDLQFIAEITVDEDTALTKAGLQSVMPPNSYTPAVPTNGGKARQVTDRLGRYKAVGIVLCD